MAREWERRFLRREDQLGTPPFPQGMEIPPAVTLGQSQGRGSQTLAGALDPGGEARRDRVGKKEIAKAIETLTRYKQGKTNLEARVVEDELWWELRHWEVIRRRKQGETVEPTSAWLFNCIMNKHADAMDNLPEPVVLPREASDEESAKMLTSVLPVVMENNEYESTFSDGWWEKLKHGTAAYGVFWNPKKENGLGDIDIRQLDLLNLFWEPGVTDIQKSRNLFVVELADEEVLDRQYPEHAGKLGGRAIDVKQYNYDETIDVSRKAVVVDWYYKVEGPQGGTVLHYAKFVGDTLLYASENDPTLADRGFYDHGLYPIVMDTLFPEKGMPVGFGYVAICKDPQLYIDKLFGHILDHAMKATKPRAFVSSSTAINEEEYLDWAKPLVHVEGELDDRRLKEIEVQPLSSIYVNIAQLKIDEMRETAANRDVNSGSASGVTAAAAIAALQEAGNKVSRDMISATFRAYVKVVTLVIELMRQFYDEERSFRITGGNQGGYRFVSLSNAALRDQPMAPAYPGQEPLFRRPVFDIKVKAQKRSPYSRLEQNQMALELYQRGFFNPEKAQETLSALEMMEFEGADKVRENVRQGQTLLNLCQQMSQQMAQMAALLQQLGGGQLAPVERAGQGTPGGEQENQPGVQGGSMGEKATQAQTRNMTSYGQKLAKRSAPSMDNPSDSASPR